MQQEKTFRFRLSRSEGFFFYFTAMVSYSHPLPAVLLLGVLQGSTGRGEERLWVKIDRSRGRLTARLSSPAATVRLYPTEENVFILKEAPDALQLTFSGGPTRRMEALTLYK